MRCSLGRRFDVCSSWCARSASSLGWGEIHHACRCHTQPSPRPSLFFLHWWTTPRHGHRHRHRHISQSVTVPITLFLSAAINTRSSRPFLHSVVTFPMDFTPPSSPFLISGSDRPSLIIHSQCVLLTPGQSFTRPHSPLHHLISHPSKDEWTYASRNHFIFNTILTQLIPWSLLPPSSSPFARSQQDRRLGGEGCRAREFRATTDPLHLSTAHGHVASTQHGVSFSLSSVRERPVTARLRDSVRTPES
jgi:hypothetical protein